MKIIVCGSRNWTDRAAIRDRLAALPQGSTVVHGASRGGGADLIAGEWAAALGHTVVEMPVGPDDYRAAPSRRAAPIFRNLRILETHPDADRVDAYWDGKSPGTRHMIEAAKRRGFKVEIIFPT